MMTNKAIARLEKYLGLLLCALLTGVRRISTLLVSATLANNPTRKIVFVKFIEQGALVLHQDTFKEAGTAYGAENIFLCTFLSNKQLLDVIKPVPEANRIFIDDTHLFRFGLSFFKALLHIRKHQIDTAIDLEFFSRATAVFCYLTGAVKRAGYHRYLGLQNYRGNLFTHRLSYSHYVHVAESSWTLLKSIALPVQELPALDIPNHSSKTDISFTPTTDDLYQLNRLTGIEAALNRPVIVINPSLNDVLPLRKWPAENFRQLVLALQTSYDNAIFVFTGRADEFDLTEKFMTSLAINKAINLCGKTQLRDILTLYSQARLLITSDSGPAHFASLTTVHTIVLFGPETPLLYAPLSKRTHVLYQSLPCSPCYNVYNNRLSACSNNSCMQRITVAEVFDKAKKIMVY